MKSSVSRGCVRLGNPDLDFQNLNPDFPIERTPCLKSFQIFNTACYDMKYLRPTLQN